MASSKTITCLDLGSQTIALAQFTPTGNGGLSLESYHTGELMADPSADGTRIPQLRFTLKDLVNETKIKGVPVIYALPGQAVFPRCVMLPSVDQSRVEQIIGFEAQQNVPFPLSDVVWDYQLISRSSSETELALIAIRKELLNEVNEAVEDAGFITSIVDVSPMALFNAYKFNYPEFDDCSLIIDIGSRTTTLIFVEPGLFFVRVLQQAGNNVTQAVAKEFDESFQEAEARKVRDGFVNLGGAYEDPADPEVARLSKVIRNATTKLHAEITRNISFYRANMKGSKPARVFLAGGGTSAPFTKEFFGEKFGLPVEYFNPLKNVLVSPAMSGNPVLSRPHLLGECVGLALRSQGPTPAEINLRPASVQKRQIAASRQPFFALAGLCVLLASLVYYLFVLQAAAKTQEQVDKLQPQVTTLTGIAANIKKAEEALKQEAAATEPLLQISNERQYWTGLIQEVNTQLPPRNIWITSMEPMKINALDPKVNGVIYPTLDNNKVMDIIEGRAGLPATTPAAASAPKPKAGQKPANTPDSGPAVSGLHVRGLYIGEYAVVEQFISKLRSSPYFDLPASDSPVTINRTDPNNVEWAYEFELNLPLKEKLPLK